ncbi:MBL fold metallo-hydrolase [Leucobacter sp. USHLN153]|uniref:MBL fold metallo-hydrolase n=1 Tax=Leucobacter sp. USHLN153 TaxID=3081268 RepID=UPI003018DB3D
MARQRIAPHVVVETEHYGSNQSCIIGSEGVALVDAPHIPSDALAWGYYVQQFGEVKYLINSDHHPDHTIGNRFLPGTVVSHAETRRRLESEEAPSMEYLEDLLGRLDPGNNHLLENYTVRLASILVENTLALHLGDVHLELRAARGHTRNNVLTYLPQDGVIFTGDIVCEAGLPSFQDSRITDWFDALDLVESYDFEQVVPGHGQVTDRAGVERYRNLGRTVVREVGERLSRGQESEQIIAEVRFEDNIHVATPCCAGYPDDLIESFQVRSITRIIEDVQQNPDLLTR